MKTCTTCDHYNTCGYTDVRTCKHWSGWHNAKEELPEKEGTYLCISGEEEFSSIFGNDLGKYVDALYFTKDLYKYDNNAFYDKKGKHQPRFVCRGLNGL